MIDRISFSGKGSAIMTRAVESAASKTHEYVSAAKIYSEKEISAAEKQAQKAVKNLEESLNDVYVSPFRQINTVENTVAPSITAEDGLSYAISHGTPERIARENGLGLNLFTSI